MRFGSDRDDRIPSGQRGYDARDETKQRWLVGGEDRDDAGGLGHGEVEILTRDGIRRAEHLRELVRPAGVPDDPIDRLLDLVTATRELCELRRSRLDHLREPIQDLAAVIRRHAGPLRECAAGRAHRIARVLARRARDVLSLGLVGAS